MVVAEALRGHPRFVDPNPRQFVQHRFVITHRHFRRADQGDAADFGAPLARERNL